MTELMRRRIESATKIILAAAKTAEAHGQVLGVMYSGGKDSDVILELTKMTGVKYRAVHLCTTCDHPGSLKHVRDMGVEIDMPKLTFAQILQKKGIPSRYMRFCCEIIKERKIQGMDYALLGIRAQESAKRKARYTEPEQCRVYNSKEKVIQYFPILDWSIVDVERFIELRNLKLAPVYYDEDGVFHWERRLGCMCCPMASRKQRIAEFKKYPNMVKLYCKNGGIWFNSHPNSSLHDRYNDIYELFTRTLFYDTNAQFEEAKLTTFANTNFKEYLEEYFNVKL